MEILEVNAQKSDLSAFSKLSADWEQEKITWGLCANKPEEFVGMRVFALTIVKNL